MDISIRFSGCKRSDFPNQDFEDVLSSSLQRFRHRLKQIHFYLEDVNGPRGGVDKQCRCVLRLRRMAPIVIQDKDASTQSLLYRVANRAAHALSKQADRKVKRGRQIRRSRN